ncbi:hypothetical protein Droror1_Dr00000783 [Drosera rotundifolia]
MVDAADGCLHRGMGFANGSGRSQRPLSLTLTASSVTPGSWLRGSGWASSAGGQLGWSMDLWVIRDGVVACVLFRWLDGVYDVGLGVCKIQDAIVRFAGCCTVAVDCCQTLADAELGRSGIPASAGS